MKYTILLIVGMLVGCTTYPTISPTTEIPPVSVQGSNIIPLWLPVSQNYIDSCNKAYLQKYCRGIVETTDSNGNYLKIQFFLISNKADSLKQGNDSLRSVISWLVKTAKQQVNVPTVRGFTQDQMDSQYLKGCKETEDKEYRKRVWTVIGLGIIILGLGGLILFLRSKLKVLGGLI